MNFKPSEETQAITFLKGIFARDRSASIETITVTKTLSQNAYIWLVFTHIGFQVGSDKTSIYLCYLKKFPKFSEVIGIKGEIEIVALTLSQFSKEQMSVFIDEVVIDARTEGIEIPDPEDKKAIELYNWYKERGQL